MTQKASSANPDPEPPSILALDVGTSSTRTLLFDSRSKASSFRARSARRGCAAFNLVHSNSRSAGPVAGSPDAQMEALLMDS